MSISFSKYNILQILLIVAASILLIKAAQLQLFQNEYKSKVENVTLQRSWVVPGRGLIFDRNNNLIVKNEPIYELKFIYNELNPHLDTNKLCDLLNITKTEFKNKMDIDWSDIRFSKNHPLVFMSKIDPVIFSKFSEHLYEFPGFYPEIQNVRSYPYPNAAHVLGYMGEVDSKKIEESEGEYSMGDYSGVTGIENIYEDDLKGTKGVKFELKDNIGRIIESYKNGELDKISIAGRDLISTIDIELQKFGEELMQNKRGAIVAIEPKTGEIIALISSPNFDPNDLSIKADRGKTFSKLINDTINKPLLNRAVTSKYPPGSVFKPLLGLIAQQMEVTSMDRGMSCNGVYEYRTKHNVFRFGCHIHPYPKNLSIAIQHSCNSYFFQLGRDVIEKYGFSKPGIGLDTMISYLNQFGLGNKTGIDLNNESSGFLPNSKYYDEIYKKQNAKWRSTYVMSLGIGQGEFEFTTLQIANVAATIANRGYFYTPHLIKSFGDGKKIPDKFKTKNKSKISPYYFNPVIDGMELVVLSGTAPSAFVPGLNICGKTGTSENFTIIDGKRVQLLDNSVFMAFAPKNDPKIAIAVYVENAGFGGTVAAPIGSMMIEKYLNGEVAFYRKWLEEKILKLDLINNYSIIQHKKNKNIKQDSITEKIDSISL